MHGVVIASYLVRMKGHGKIGRVLLLTGLIALVSLPALARDPESVLLERINVVRLQNGLSPLGYAGDRVREVARAYSERMLEEDFFAHQDDHGATAGDRLSMSGIDWRMVGENLLEDVGAPNGDAVVDDAVTAWLESPGHRANILNAKYTETAVGLATRGGRTYLTQLFLAP